MSPDRRSSFRPPNSKAESTANRRRSQRIAVTEDLSQFMQTSPLVLVPNSRTNIESNSTSTLKRGTGIMKLPSSPVKKMNVKSVCTPEVIVGPKTNDFRDNENLKATFLSALDLVNTRAVAKPSSCLDESDLPAPLQHKLKSRKNHVVTFFRKNPLPVSSKLGRKVVLKAGFGKCNNPREEVLKLERACTVGKHRTPNSVPSWPQVNVRKFKSKPGQYFHKYSYGRQQRVQRNVELVVGLSQRSFGLLNSCRRCRVKLHRMSDEEVAVAMTKIQGGQSSPIPPKKSLNPSDLSWIASEPTAGPSRGVERLGSPVVRLYDIRLSPSKSKYFLKD